MKRLHFIGIKGVGMSALALVAQGMGYQVTGSDTGDEFITDEPLRRANIPTKNGFNRENINTSIDVVVVGAAYGSDNPEVAEAKRLNIPAWHYSELLGHLSKEKETIAVAGTHGKTTTTAILSYLLHHSGRSPSFVIGTGHIAGLPAHGLAGKGRYFITEADDYKRSPTDPIPKFLDLAPYAVIITSIEHDHPDLYPTLKDVIQAFFQLVLKVSSKGFLVVNSDEVNVRRLCAKIADRRFVGYGFDADASYRIKMIRTKVAEPERFRLITRKKSYGPFTTTLRGKHNLYNAAAAITMALELGVEEEAIQKLLPHFVSVERRLQYLGSVRSIDIYDDYAHHPTSVRLTLETLKRIARRRPLWCFFQSHTYSRTRALLDDFGKAFTHATVVIVTDIFASAREQADTIDSEDLVDEISKYQKNVHYVPKRELLAYMRKNVPDGAVVVTMGAGDIYKVGREFVAEATVE